MEHSDRICKSCGSSELEARFPKHGLVCNRCRHTAHRKRAEKNVAAFLKRRLLVAQNRVRKKGREKACTVTPEELVKKYEDQQGMCALSGVAMTHSSTEEEFSISLDRIDNLEGYTNENVHLTCAVANRMKGVMTTEKFVWWCRMVRAKNEN